jgi:hypothetical protein
MDEFQSFDPENLDDRVLVYGIFQPEDITLEPKIIGGYASRDKNEFCQTMNIHRDLELTFSSQGKELNGWYRVVQDFENEDELPKDCPRYFAGQYPDYDECQKEVWKALRFQIKELRRGERLSEDLSETEVKNYKDVPPEKMEEYVLEHFISAALELQEVRDYDGIASIMRRFKGFSFNSHFGHLVDEIQLMMYGEPSEDILQLYAKQIAALNLENYETAAPLRDKIKLFTQKV